MNGVMNFLIFHQIKLKIKKNKKAFRADAKTLKYELRIDSISPRLVKRLKKDKKLIFKF